MRVITSVREPLLFITEDKVFLHFMQKGFFLFCLQQLFTEPELVIRFDSFDSFGFGSVSQYTRVPERIRKQKKHHLSTVLGWKISSCDVEYVKSVQVCAEKISSPGYNEHKAKQMSRNVFL